MNDWILIAVIGILLLLAMFFLPQLLLSRAIKKVIQIFRDKNAVGMKNAKTLKELGLEPKGMFENIMKPRDYKPRALQYMIGAGIIQMTEDEKLYLLEEKLANTKFAHTGY